MVQGVALIHGLYAQRASDTHGNRFGYERRRRMLNLG